MVVKSKPNRAAFHLDLCQIEPQTSTIEGLAKYPGTPFTVVSFNIQYLQLSDLHVCNFKTVNAIFL